jgi:MPBQ/MSBQ methyltransferase
MASDSTGLPRAGRLAGPIPDEPLTPFVAIAFADPVTARIIVRFGYFSITTERPLRSAPMPTDNSGMRGAQLRAQMYGPNDLSQLPIFAGGFINFGYWRDISTDGPISVSQRIESQRAMYRLIADDLGISPADRVLEVGFGRGLGSVLIANSYRPAEMHGIDLSPEQVERAHQLNADTLAAYRGRLAFRHGAAEDIPFPDNHFTKLISVEAAQHFEDIPGFVNEAARVLAPGGRLSVVSFFAVRPGQAEAISELLETFASGVDLATDIGSVLTTLRAAGFEEVSAESIGRYVWLAFDRWMEHTEYADSWVRNWLVAYQRGLLDYYLISGHRPH